ncbi:MAG: hypothetical protein RIC03_02200 [Cyclobacteriaceae bacterium]
MKYLHTVLLFCCFQSLFGQSLDQTIFSPEIESMAFNIENKLVSVGFENVKAIPLDSIIIIAYENRIRRFEIDGLAQVLLHLPVGTSFKYVLIPHYQSIPMVSVMVQGNDMDLLSEPSLTAEFVDKLVIELNTDRWKYDLTKGEFKNSTLYKADFAIGPVISATQFGNYNRHIRTIIDLAPALHIQLRKGLSFNAQALFPVFNNYNDDKLRVGIFNLTQHIRLKNNAFASLSVGNFNRRRMGYLINYNKYIANGRISFGATLGGTTWSRYSGELLSDFFEKYNYLYARANVGYRWSKYDVITNISYGTFMIQDRGWRIDVARQFGQSQIGVFGTFTELLNNAGFKVSFALPTKQYSSFNRNIRLRTTEYLQYEYKFTGQTLRGLDLNSGNEIHNQILEINPDFIKNQLIFLLNP